MSDRPSWRDIDRKRDQSDHTERGGERPGRPGARVSSAKAAYKRELDALFDRGVVPDRLKEKLDAVPMEGQGEGKERQEALRAVRAANSGPELNRAVDDLRDRFGLPDDLEILLRALEHPKDAVLRDALALIEPHVECGDRLPKRKIFVERLKGLELTSFDPRVQRKAAALVAQLR